MAEYDISFLAQMIPNLKYFYDILTNVKGYYLPDFSNKMNTNYLLKVANNEVFTLKQKDVRIGSLRKRVQVSDLAQALQENSELPLGFNMKDKPPAKEWFVNCLHTVCPQHPFFKKPGLPITRKLPEK